MDKKPIPTACQEAAERYIKTTRRIDSYKGHSVRMCDVCGHMEWVSSSNDYNTVVLIWKSEDIHFDRPCPSCLEAGQRAPELVQWFMGVMTMLELRIRGELPK
jgi:hypothetical protein